MYTIRHSIIQLCLNCTHHHLRMFQRFLKSAVAPTLHSGHSLYFSIKPSFFHSLHNYLCHFLFVQLSATSCLLLSPFAGVIQLRRRHRKVPELLKRDQRGSGMQPGEGSDGGYFTQTCKHFERAEACSGFDAAVRPCLFQKSRCYNTPNRCRLVKGKIEPVTFASLSLNDMSPTPW